MGNAAVNSQFISLTSPSQSLLTFIVVLNYQGTRDTVHCIRRVREQDYPNYRVLVVDNGSPDGSEARLRDELPGETIMQRGRNLGYGDGNNLGIEMALAEGADFIWMVSPDVHVPPDCLSRLVTLMKQHPEIGICGPVVHAGGRAVTRWDLVERLGFQVWAHSVRESALRSQPEYVETGFVEGGAMLIRSNVVRRVGAFRTDLFMYYEDCELSLRAKDAGWKVAICMSAHVSTRWNDGSRNQRYYYMTRNSIVLARLRHSHVWSAVARNLVLLPLYVLFKHQRLSTSLRAVWDGLSRPLERKER
jgi:GT2 family glycosyltransferase